MAPRRDLAFELLAVMACALAAAALFWVLSSWSTTMTLLVTAAVVLVGGFVAWRSHRPYVVLGVAIVCAAGVAVSQGYVMERMFADFCIFEPCGAPETRLASFFDALRLSVLPILLGFVTLAAVARRKAGVAPPQP